MASHFHSSLIAKTISVSFAKFRERELLLFTFTCHRELCLMNYRPVCFRDNLSTFSKSQGSYLESAAVENEVNKMRSRVSESLVMG